MRKGFFFSLDVLIAIIIAFVLIAGIFYHILRGQEDKYANLYMSKVANDALVSLGKNKTLETLDDDMIKNILTEILPKNFAYKLNITVYECSDAKCSSFVRVPSEDVNILYPEDATEQDSLPAKRGFVTFEDNEIEYFALAELRVWLI
jgi:hypothetical protein